LSYDRLRVRSIHSNIFTHSNIVIGQRQIRGVITINQDIFVIRNSGRILFALLLLIVLVQGVFAVAPCTLIKTWGPYEGGSNSTAYGVAVDASGDVSVADTGNSRVLHYSSDGSIISTWNLKGNVPGLSDVAYPYGIAVDAIHDVYVTDIKNSTVLKFTTRGVEVWGSEGSGDGQFSHPTGIAVDSSGNVYVADTGNNRIQKIHSTGRYLMKWGSYGTTDGVFNAPEGVTVDAYGHIYVADTGNRRIQKFSPAGTFLAKWGSEGNGTGQFSTPTGIATDSWGDVWVADLTSRVQKFNPTGEYLSTCDTGGKTNNVAIGSSGYLYALGQPGPLWNIGKYGTAAVIPTQTPRQARTFSIEVKTRPTTAVPASSQNSTIPAQPPVSPATGLVTAPDASPATMIAPALTLPSGYDAGIAAPGDQHEGEVRKTDVQKGIFDRVSQFFRDVFGVEINFSA
jgi:sugar lactone lactonase YvrE